jgi:hypothetical protein
MSHLDQVALLRRQLTQKEYSEAISTGRRELASGCDSSELLVLMATAVLLSDGSGGSLDEARQWLERAANGDPRNVDASLELAHFLDAVADEPELAATVFESAALHAIKYLEDALAGLASVGHAGVDLRSRATEILQNLAALDVRRE